MGSVHVFKSGRMMFKHKNKFFSFPETLFIYYFKSFYLFFGGGGELADAPRSQLCPGSLWPARTRSAPRSVHGRQGQVARLRAHSRQLCPDPRDGQDRESEIRN